MDEFECARLKYKPESPRFVFVAEAPPSRESGRFFYFESVATGDSLFLETMKVLYPNECSGAGQVRAAKRRFLERFRDDGFYLIDASREPMVDSRPAVKRKQLRDSLDQLIADMTSFRSVKVVLISQSVYDVCRGPLADGGWNVINTEFIDFPGSGRQGRFREKLIKLLVTHGWPAK